MDSNRIFGGNPFGVLVRLVLLSIVVGIVLSALGLQPRDLVTYIQTMIRRIANMGFGAVETAFAYFLAGAVVVVPIWLIARLLTGLRKRDDDRRT
jgi:hypothetical protein